MNEQSLPDPEPVLRPPKKRRFSTDSINDLLFWGVHLCIVAISLAIVWTKLDGNKKLFLELIHDQNEEIDLVKKQTTAAERTEAQAKENAQRAQTEINTIHDELSSILMEVSGVTNDVKDTLGKTNKISEIMLQAVNETKEAAQTASQDAQTAAETSQASAEKLKPEVKVRTKTRTIYRVKKKPKNWFQRLFNL